MFYLIHVGGDSDESWTSVGRANFILDNLIARGKAVPMIVVMPHGHTTAERVAATRTRPPGSSDDFPNDFLKDVVPYVEKHYRVRTDRASRAIAGLSQGGGQSLSIAIPNLPMFGYIGIFSSGLYQLDVAAWEKEHLAEIDNAAWKKRLRLFWFSTGSDDFILPSAREALDMLRRHGFTPVYKDSAGAHSWVNWRNYLRRVRAAAVPLAGRAGRRRSGGDECSWDNGVFERESHYVMGVSR